MSVGAVDRIVELLGSDLSERRLAAGEVLCEENSVGTDAYLVNDGQVDAVIVGAQDEFLVASHHRGALIGEVAAVIGGRRTATLRAASDATVSVITQQQLADAFEADPDAASALLERARQRTERTRVASMMAREFYATDPAAVTAISERVGWRTLAAGQRLFSQGDPADAAYLVISGRLHIFQEDGTDLGDFGRGDVIGEIGLVEQGPRSASVEARRDTTLARLTAEDFAALSHSHAGLAMGLVRRILNRNVSRLNAIERASRSVALVEVEPRAGRDEAFAEALIEVGTTMHLSADRVDDMMAQDGIATTESDGFGDIRLAELFHFAEANHDHVLMVCDAQDTPWSRRVLRHADLVVVAVPPRPSTDAVAAVERIVADLSDQVPVWLLVDHPAGTTQPRGTARLIDRLGASEAHHVLDNRPSDIARIARLAAGVGTALVLGGGGARGFAHLGVMRALEELEVPIDRVVGTSMGAVVAGGFAKKLPPDRRVAVAAAAMHNLLDYTVPVVSLIKGERITASIRTEYGGWDIADLWIPFACVSTNLTTSKSMVHRRGALDTAVRASVSLPGILPPVPFDGDLLVDGGILNNLPADVMYEDPSIATVIACDVTPPLGPASEGDIGLHVSGWSALRAKLGKGANPYPGLGAVLMRSMLLGSTRERDRHVEVGGIDLYLDLDLAEIGLLDFETVAPVADRGYQVAKPRIAAWLAERRAAPSRSVER